MNAAVHMMHSQHYVAREFQQELYPYQIAGVEFLVNRRRALLLDQQGLGKTPQAIRAADVVNARVVNVVCPAIGRVMWARAFSRWATELHSVRVFSYDEIAIAEELPRACELLILDEVQQLKNQTSKRARHIYGHLASGKNCMIANADYVWALSGTLTPNGPHELYAHLRALFPELITHNGKPLLEWEFRERYFIWYTDRFGEPRVKRPKPGAVELLRSLVAPHALRRLKKAVLPELPPLTTEIVHLPGEEARYTREQRELIELAVSAMERGEEVDEIPLATIRRFTGQAKLAPVLEYLHLVLECEPKVVVFAYHRDVIEWLRAGLAKYGAVVIQGGMTDRARQRSIDDFQEKADCRVCIGQITACNAVIDLSASAREVFAEWSWVPGENAQAAERCHRFTTKGAVLASFLSLPGSLDEAMTRVVVRKTAAIAALWRE